MTFPTLAIPEAPRGSMRGACAVCGVVSDDAHASPISDNYVDVGCLAAPRSRVTCRHCTAILGRTDIVTKSGTNTLGWRMFSLLARDGHPVERESKAGKARIRQWLLDAPYPERWGAYITDTGKKQLAPFTPVNPAQGLCRVRFETLIVSFTPSTLRSVLELVEHLYAVGASKAEIESGAIGTGRLRKLSREDILGIRPLLRANARLAGTPLHTLAVWVAQKEEEHDGHDDGDE